MKIQILGTGCPKCERLAAAAEEAAKSLQVDYVLQKVKDLDQIMALGVMVTPALAVDGVVKSVGKVPTVAELKAMLQS